MNFNHIVFFVRDKVLKQRKILGKLKIWNTKMINVFPFVDVLVQKLDNETFGSVVDLKVLGCRSVHQCPTRPKKCPFRARYSVLPIFPWSVPIQKKIIFSSCCSLLWCHDEFKPWSHLLFNGSSDDAIQCNSEVYIGAISLHKQSGCNGGLSKTWWNCWRKQN